MKLKYYWAVKVGGNYVAYGSEAKCRSYYKRNHWGSKDGVIVKSTDAFTHSQAVVDGARKL